MTATERDTVERWAHIANVAELVAKVGLIAAAALAEVADVFAEDKS